MIPRALWDQNPSVLDMIPIENLRGLFAASQFCPDKQYIQAITMTGAEGKKSQTTFSTCQFDHEVIRGSAIVDALTAGLRGEDLEDAFLWLESRESSGNFSHPLQEGRPSGSSFHAVTPPLELPGVHNKVACMLMQTLGLEFDIRLTGLCSAAHLNGREGVIRGSKPACPDQFRARLDDGTIISVRSINFVYIRRGDYKRSAVRHPARNS